MPLSRILLTSLALIGLVSACALLPTPAPAIPPVVSPTASPVGLPSATATARPGRLRGTVTSPAPTQAPATLAALTTPTLTSPAPNPAYSLLSVHLQAVQVSDDDGQRQVNITPAQVTQWVEKANEIYALASIRFEFDPAADFAPLKNTVLNDMAGDSDTNWKREVVVGNRVAAGYSGKLVVFFIHGPGPGRTGGGFSSAVYNFVEMPGFNDTTVCGYQNSGILGHEVGHYLGLAHPFALTFANLPEAEAYFINHGHDPAVFDGDGLSDTPPDPFISQPEFQCRPTLSVTLDGQAFPLPRQNIMSYYSNAGVDRTELTPQQSNLARFVLQLRAKNGMATPTNINVPGAIEFESLPVKNAGAPGSNTQDMSPFGDAPRWSHDKQLFVGAQLNSVIEFNLPVAAAGQQQLNLYATLAPDFGAIQTLVDGRPLGVPLDLYAPLVLPSGRLSVGALALTAGAHTLGFRVVGKNAASAGYSLGLDAFTLAPPAP